MKQQKYTLNFMSPNLHKFLIYGSETVENAILPNEELSEKAQEHKNKNFEFNCK